MVSILGCGWLGLPLGKFLVDHNFSVKGSTTRIEKLQKLSASGILPFHLCLSPTPEGDDWDIFLESEVLIINIPPQISSKGNIFHQEQIGNLIEQIKKTSIRKILYVSSTSVYPDTNTEVNELSGTVAGNAMVEAENKLRASKIPLTVLRCGGLMGYDRVPAKYFSGKQITNADVRVNYIHRDDVINVVHFIIVNNIWHECFNLVSPVHPSRKEIYIKNSIDFNIEMPIFPTTTIPVPFKIVNAEKIINAGYKFLFPDPSVFYYEVNK